MYEPVQPKAPKPELPAAARELPENWKERMRQAVVEADVAYMQDLIQEITGTFPTISATLSERLYHFDYDGIRSLLELP